jgi:amino acid transporter, AAT family
MERKGKGLSALQLTMFALGTIVGGSFFLGSAIVIRTAGPSALLAFVIGGVLVYFILTAMSEMTVANPHAGSFRSYTEKAFGKGAGYIVGWVYWSGLVLAMSSEATAVSILFRNWFPGISLPLFGSIVIVSVTCLNLLGAERLSRVESGLAMFKLLAIAAFIVIAICFAVGIGTGAPSAMGLDVLGDEGWMPGGIRGIAGSMLVVMFSYSGFEVLGLTASSTADPAKTIPKAIKLTTVLLVGLYLAAITSLFLLIPFHMVSLEVSPFVSALSLYGLGWTGSAMSIVLITAILSAMLASVFGLGQMLRSLADEGHTPVWMRDSKATPYRGILISGAAIWAGLGMGMLLPQGVYLFLVSSGGFSVMFTYAVIMASHYRLRKRNGGPFVQGGGMRGFPYTSWLTIGSLIAIIVSMPLIPGQRGGLIAGILFVVVFSGLYAIGVLRRRAVAAPIPRPLIRIQPDISPIPRMARVEMSEELTEAGTVEDKQDKDTES